MSWEMFSIVLIGILSPAVTLLLGWWQRRNEHSRLPAQNMVDFSEAMENYGSSWNILKIALEGEIERLKVQSVLREKDLLERLSSVETKLNEAKYVIYNMEIEEQRRFFELNSRLVLLEKGTDALIKQVKDLGEIPVFNLLDSMPNPLKK